MSPKPVKNVSASVHQRLLNRAQALGRPFNELLQYFAIERFLYRLSCSPHRDSFVLKGGLMFAIWQEPFVRPTRDVDLLGYGAPLLDRLATIVRELCLLEVVDDGLRFDVTTVAVTPIRAAEIYDGIRIQFVAHLGPARVPMQIDVGFGDIVIPTPVEVVFPALLNLPAAQLRGYSRESLIAEKVHAMVMRGAINSRMKDFYDLWLLSKTFAFVGETLGEALQQTFARRQTPLPVAATVILQPLLAAGSNAHVQWQAFLRRTHITDAPPDFGTVARQIKLFLQPVLTTLATPGVEFGHWQAPGPWRSGAA